MRSTRTLAAGCLAAAAVAGLLLSMVAIRSGEPRDALALSPTPTPLDIEWTVTIAGDVAQGESFTVHASATPKHTGSSYGAMMKSPVYSVTIDGDDGSYEAPYDPELLADGVSWKIVGGIGTVTLTFRLDYTLSYNITGTPPGSYSVSDTTTETIEVASPPPQPNGDVNEDGITNSIDALLLLQYQAGLICIIDEPCPYSTRIRGDVNQDGTTNSLDATLILQYAAGLVQRLPIPVA